MCIDQGKAVDIQIDNPEEVLNPPGAHSGRRKSLEISEKVSHIVKPTTSIT